MAITRSTGALFGTDEATGISIANNATTYTGSNSTNASGAEADVLGDNVSVGDIWLYAVITQAIATNTGSIDITINSRRVSGQPYARQSLSRSLSSFNSTATQKIPLGRMPASRYMNAAVTNNSTGTSATVAVLYELEKLT